MRLPWQRKTDVSLDTLLQRLEATFATGSGVVVTPETCMESPTVQAIVTVISRRLSVSPLRVLRKSTDSDGRTRKDPLPIHPVQRLLDRPNDWQDRVEYWLDATSSLLRYGNYYAFKSRGKTGPVRRLLPLHASAVTVKRDPETLEVSYRARLEGAGQRLFEKAEIHHARGPARDFVKGNSPVTDARESIALEIAAERFGAEFFGNGAMPLLIFQLMTGFKDFKDEDAAKAFLTQVNETVGNRKRFSSLMLPKGMEMGDTPGHDFDKAQMLETRKHQRTVIAGAWGVPPTFVGDLERAHFNNVEQMDSDFVINVILPWARVFESAIERDLLSVDDRRSGVIVRFNLDAVLRADFQSRQEGLKIQRESGVINPNEWREADNRNPISEEDGGEDYIVPLNMRVVGEEPPPPAPPPDDDPPEVDQDDEND